MAEKEAAKKLNLNMIQKTAILGTDKEESAQKPDVAPRIQSGENGVQSLAAASCRLRERSPPSSR